MKMRNINNYIFLGLLCLASEAWTISDPCSLYRKEVPEQLGLSETSLLSYKEKLKTECQLTIKYQTLRYELYREFRIRPQDITEYQAMRFVRRVNFEHSKIKEIPIELTYQTKNEFYALPNEQKSSVIWDNWIRGIMQLNPVKQRVLNGDVFDYEMLKRVHVGFFQLSREIGDHAHVPDEGVIKPPVEHDNYWWVFNTAAEAQAAKIIVDEINLFFREIGFTGHFSDEKLNRVLDVRTVVRRKPPVCDESGTDVETLKKQKDAGCDRVQYVDAIFSGYTKANRVHLEVALSFVKSVIENALADRHIIWKGRLFTPTEAAYLAQKFYVAIHPFSEGNGRTSRFIQELILSVMDMPHGSSGDLMDIDVLSSFEEYYTKAVASQAQLLEKIEQCKNIYSQLSDINLASSAAKQIDYSCRLLPAKSTEAKEQTQQRLNLKYN